MMVEWSLHNGCIMAVWYLHDICAGYASAYHQIGWLAGPKCMGGAAGWQGGSHRHRSPMNLNPAIGGEQQRREDAKRKAGNGKFEGWFGFTCQLKASSFREMP